MNEFEKQINKFAKYIFDFPDITVQEYKNRAIISDDDIFTTGKDIIIDNYLSFSNDVYKPIIINIDLKFTIYKKVGSFVLNFNNLPMYYKDIQNKIFKHQQINQALAIIAGNYSPQFLIEPPTIKLLFKILEKNGLSNIFYFYSYGKFLNDIKNGNIRI